MNYMKKLLVLIVLAMVLTVVLPFLIEFHWWYIPIVIANYLIFKGIGSEVGAHRLWSHKAFVTSDIRKRVIMVLQLISGEGSCLSFVGVHRLHHQHSDTPDDPHSPHYGSLFNTMFYQHEIYGFNVKLVKDVLREPWMLHLHKHYFKYHIAMVLAMLLTTSWTLLWFYSINIVWTWIINNLVNVVCHLYGKIDHPYRQDQSRNNNWVEVILLGVGQHNNHHKDPGATSNGPYDVWGWIIDKIRTT
jgi:sn-1 stearoyl-lipid 9-desaturase|tara:strand:- start:851 stop:1585 length:735 start_codon:yes stop_codon:yes gene_type:complete